MGEIVDVLRLAYLLGRIIFIVVIRVSREACSCRRVARGIRGVGRGAQANASSRRAPSDRAGEAAHARPSADTRSACASDARATSSSTTTLHR